MKRTKKEPKPLPTLEEISAALVEAIRRHSVLMTKRADLSNQIASTDMAIRKAKSDRARHTRELNRRALKGEP